MKVLAVSDLTTEEKTLLMNLRKISRQIADEALELPRERAEEHIEARISDLVQELALTSQPAAEAAGNLLRSQIAAHRAH